MRMYTFNEEKVFVDSIDDQMVALVIETGSYYTFNEVATAVIHDLVNGFEPSDLVPELERIADGEDAAAQLDAFVKELLDKGILDELPWSDGSLSAMECASLERPEEGLSLEMQGYDDVAEYFMIDPIHEVDPDMGWPYASQE